MEKMTKNDRIASVILILLLLLTNMIWLAVTVRTQCKDRIQEMTYCAYISCLEKCPANQKIVGSPDKALVPFEHDYTGLIDQEVNGHHYRDSEWEHLFPGRATLYRDRCRFNLLIILYL